jgi:hypothetical protein
LQFGNHATQALHFARDALCRFLALLWMRYHIVGQRLTETLDSCERRSKIMSDIGQQFTTCLLLPAQFIDIRLYSVGHLVKCLCQLTNFILCLGSRDALRIMAQFHLLGGLRQGFERIHQAMCEEEAKQRRAQRYEDRSQQDSTINFRDKVIVQAQTRFR